jgi:hypothetical protein
MFGRRGQRQLRGRGMGRRGAPPVLQHANQLMMAGDYVGAADAFNQLAQGAETLFPRRAPFLFVEAGRTAILGGDVQSGVISLKRGLTLLASQGRLHRMQTLGQRVVGELRTRGLDTEAEEISSMLGLSLPKEPLTEPVPSRRPVLPTHCPSCGGTVKPNEIEWLDNVTAECDYCGSPLRGE